MTVPQHQISVVADGQVIPGWESYDISVDMLQPADAFNLSVAFSREAWDLLATDVEIGVFVDETRILTGLVGRREKVPSRRGGTMLQVSGRDKTGRLVDESAPQFSYGGLGIKELAERIAGVGEADALFDRVVLVNTRNRSLLRNVRAQQAQVFEEPFLEVAGAVAGGPANTLARLVSDQRNASSAATSVASAAGFRAPSGVVGKALDGTRIPRPPIIDPGILSGRAAPRRVTPGQTRWAVLEEFLAEARLLAWSTADGRDLFVGVPNHDQGVQYRFFEAAQGSRDRASTNAKITVIEDVEERYSMITAVGASKGATKHRASVYDNPQNTTDGTGIAFRRAKRLTVADDGIRNARGALERAEREKLERDAGGHEVVIDAPGHSQLYAGDVPTIFAVDTIAEVFDEDTGTRGDYLITAVQFSRSRGGTRTQLRAVPRGTVLTL